MKLSTKQILIERLIFEDGDFNCSYSVLLEILEELCDGGRIKITDGNIKQYLEQKCVVHWDGFFKFHTAGEKFDEFYKNFWELSK